STECVDRTAEKVDDANRLFLADTLQVDDDRAVALQIVGDFLSLFVGTRLSQYHTDLLLGMEGNHFVSPPPLGLFGFGFLKLFQFIIFGNPEKTHDSIHKVADRNRLPTRPFTAIHQPGPTPGEATWLLLPQRRCNPATSPSISGELGASDPRADEFHHGSPAGGERWGGFLQNYPNGVPLSSTPRSECREAPPPPVQIRPLHSEAGQTSIARRTR